MAKESKPKNVKDLADALAQLEKKHGKGILIDSANFVKPDVDCIPSGSIAIDGALGIGGYPRGRIIEVYGPESSGKTTLTLHAVAEAQKKGGKCAFIDVEHALDLGYAQKLGVDTKALLMSQPDCGEEAIDVVETLTLSGEISVIVIDSVSALVPRAEIEGDIGDRHVGVQARMMSQAMRKLVGIASKSSTTIFFINQIRMKIGVMFGSPETTSGGQALKFYSSVRLDVRRIATNKDGDSAVSNRTRVKVVKNKIAPPHTIAEFDIVYGQGIDKVAELLDFSVEQELVEQKGAWFSYNGERVGQGRANAIKYLSNHPKMLEELETGVRKNICA